MATLQVGPHTVEITHSDRVLFPEDGITKGDLIDYYLAVAETMLPHLRNRLLTLNRYPGGIKKEGFVQRGAPDYYPDWITRISVEKEGGRLTELVCDNAATLVYLANQSCITLHSWLSRIDKLDYPDRMVLDLDPAVDDFERVRAAARLLHLLLDEMGLPSFIMTTGSRGLHVSIPLDRSQDFDEVRSSAQQIAAELVRRDPKHLTVESRKEQRQGRLYIDTLRNSYAQTAVAPYAVRARPGAPVAMPLDWGELDDPALTSRRYTIRNVLHRLKKSGK